MEEGTTTAEVNETSEVLANHNPMCLICNIKFKMPTTPEELDMLIHSQEELSKIEECFALNFDISAEELEEVSFFNQPDLIPFCTSCSQLVKRLHAEQVALLELVQKFNKTREDIVTILVNTFLYTSDHPFFNMKNLIYEKWTKNYEEDLGEETYEEETVEPTLLIEDSNEDAETKIQHSLQKMTAQEISAEGVASTVQPTNKKKPEEVMIGMETVETEKISQLTPTSETAAVEEVAAASTDTVQPPQHPSETVEKETAPPPKKRRRKGPFLTYRTRSKARVQQRKLRNKSNSSPPPPLLQKEDKEKEKSNTEPQAKVPLSPPVLHRADCTENESPNPDESNKGLENHPKTVKLPNDFAQDSINADSAIIEQAQTNYPGFKDLNFNSAVLAEPIEIVEPSSEAEPVKDKEPFCSSEKAPNKASEIKDNSTKKTRKIYGPKSKLEGIRARVLAIESRIHKIQSNNIEKNRKVMRAKPGSGSGPLRHTKAKARVVEPLVPSPTKSNSADNQEIVSPSPCTNPNPPISVPLTTPNTSEVKKPCLKTYGPKSKQASQNLQIKQPVVPSPVTEIHNTIHYYAQDGRNNITEKSGTDKLDNRIIIKRVNDGSNPTWQALNPGMAQHLSPQPTSKISPDGKALIVQSCMSKLKSKLSENATSSTQKQTQPQLFPSSPTLFTRLMNGQGPSPSISAQTSQMMSTLRTKAKIPGKNILPIPNLNPISKPKHPTSSIIQNILNLRKDDSVPVPIIQSTRSLAPTPPPSVQRQSLLQYVQAILPEVKEVVEVCDDDETSCNNNNNTSSSSLNSLGEFQNTTERNTAEVEALMNNSADIRVSIVGSNNNNVEKEKEFKMPRLPAGIRLVEIEDVLKGRTTQPPPPVFNNNIPGSTVVPKRKFVLPSRGLKRPIQSDDEPPRIRIKSIESLSEAGENNSYFKLKPTRVPSSPGESQQTPTTSPPKLTQVPWRAEWKGKPLVKNRRYSQKEMVPILTYSEHKQQQQQLSLIPQPANQLHPISVGVRPRAPNPNQFRPFAVRPTVSHFHSSPNSSNSNKSILIPVQSVGGTTIPTYIQVPTSSLTPQQMGDLVENNYTIVPK